jgi:hypothetical protein
MVRRREVLVIHPIHEREKKIMVSIDKNKPSRQDRLRKIRAGLQLHEQGATVITIGGVGHTVTDLLAKIQDDITATDATDKARAEWLQSVQSERDSHQQVDPLLRGIKQFVMLQYGDSQAASATLADFGYTPRKVPVRSPTTSVAAANKSRATRKARNTMGAKQKKAVKGDVTGVVVTPVHGTPAPAPPTPTPPSGPTAAPVPVTPAAGSVTPRPAS